VADWQAIRAEYEQGASQRSLATKYGISQAAISKRCLKEGWVIASVVMPTESVVSDNTVDQALADLAVHLTDHPERAKLQLTQHKLFADAFSSYMKAKTLAPVEEDISTYDMRDFLAHCTDEELAIVRPIIATVQARREKIIPLHKTG
jgi:hypothetical protein